MSIEHPESSVNELLIPSAEENEKKAEAKLQWLFLPARLFLIIIDIGIVLCGVDIGFFGCGWSLFWFVTVELVSFDVTSFSIIDVAVWVVHLREP